ncbi:iron ABC transporter substrate-binding protein [Kallotenue papyrolyticum]|uniref:iron ABC transporter substrate-binding protein n=1 Tax=Kallotenue papyrolyticum TaxID=1325125 RepID=UPI0004785C21
MKRLLFILLPALLLGACGTPGGSAGSGQPAAASPAAEDSPATGQGSSGTLIVYSGRNEQLIGPLVEQFRSATGIDLQVKYGDTAELAQTILDEGQHSPADIFFAQDAGALGALQKENRLQPLPEEFLQRVDARFRSDTGHWVGVSGRARVVVYNTKVLTETDLPETIFGFTDPQWKGRLGWAPTNGSFQSFVTALRKLEGEERAREWLTGIQANQPKVYPNNMAIVQAVGAGEIDAGFVNHYYLFRALKEHGEAFPARNYFLKNGDPGALVNVAGVALLDTAKHGDAARRFIDFLLSREAQQYFADQTYEYPLIEGVQPNPLLPPLSEIQAPQIDLSDLDDLQGTLKLLQDTGVLP